MTQARTTIDERLNAARTKLEAVDQEHVLKSWYQLDDRRQSELLDQIDSVDWPEVARLVRTHVLAKPRFEFPADVQPAPWYPHTPTPQLKTRYQQARRHGEELVRHGKVAAFTVAGGQGTRLGWPGPKGTFPATPVRKTPLFACLAQYIQKVQHKYEAIVPWYVMTSRTNDADTRAYFQDNDYFGLDAGDVEIFPQEMMPALDMRTGKVLMAGPHEISLAPNGHGGALKALATSGALDDMNRRGITQISYVQIDNPIVRVVDPLFLGLHDLDGAQMSSKMLPKAFGKEKLGNLCMVAGKITVIEYSDLPEKLAEERLDNGALRFRAGSIAIHALRVDFVERINRADGGFALPYHRAEKKAPYFDADANKVIEPDAPNAVKLETFVFDALPMCAKSIVYEADRIDEFAPIKNAEGVDSPATSIAIQSERAGRWLEQFGVQVPRDSEGRVDALIDLSPLTAIESHDLDSVDLPPTIPRRGKVTL